MINLQKLYTLALLGALLLTVPTARAQSDAGPPASLTVTRVEATAARVDGDNQLFAHVRLLDAEGRPVPNAQIQSASITLDGDTPVEASFGQEAESVAVLLALDISGSMVGARIDAARAAALTFVDAKRPDDQIGVLLFNNRLVHSTDFTAAPDAVQEALSSPLPTQTAGACLWDALHAAVTQTRRAPFARRMVLVVTDGVDQTLPGGPSCDTTTLDDVINVATEGTRVPVYILGVGNAQSLNADDLQRLSDTTGGMLALGKSDEEIGALFDTLVDGLRAEFVVSAVMAVPSGVHDVEIGVTLDDGQAFVAFASVNVPVPVFIPPTLPPVGLPTSAHADADTPEPTAEDAHPTAPPGTTTPPEIVIAEMGQDAANGDLLLRLEVQEHGAAVTAVKVLLDDAPLLTLPPGDFSDTVRVPLGNIAEGIHTLTVEAYDTSGQVGRVQVEPILQAPAAIIAQNASPTPDGFTLSDPATAMPTEQPSTPSAAPPATLTPRPTHATPAQTETPTEDETSPGGGMTGPALMFIGAIIIGGGLLLTGLWIVRARRLRPQSTGPTGTMQMPALKTGPPGTPPEGFRYDAYGDRAASSADDAAPTDFFRGDEDESTALWLGDVVKAKVEVVRSTDMEARVNSPYMLETPRVTLGRDVSNDIPFAGDRFVSSQHVRILYIDGQWFLQELGALNKTFVNGRAITGRVPLFDGDLIGLGPYTRLRFTVEETDSPAPPPPLGQSDDDEADDLTHIRV